MSRHVFTAFVVILILWVGLAPAEDKKPLENPDAPKFFVDGWTYARERKTKTGSNRVTANFKVKNVTGSTIESVSASLIFLSGTGEKVGGPLVQQLGQIRPNQAQPFEQYGEFIPIFSSYEITVSYTGPGAKPMKEKWFSNSDLGQPDIGVDKPIEGAANVVLLGQEAGPDKGNKLSGEVRVKNVGTVEAKNVKLIAGYYNTPPPPPPPVPPPGAKKNPKDKGPAAPGGPTNKDRIAEDTIVLGTGTMKGGEEKVIKFAFNRSIQFKYFTLKVTCDEVALENQLSGGEFQNMKDLDSAHWLYKRSGKNDENLDVSVDLRNGTDQALPGVKITFTFTLAEKGKNMPVKTYTHHVNGPIATGQIVSTKFTIEKMPKYDGVETEFGLGGESAKPAEPQFSNADKVEVLIKDVQMQADGSAKVVGAARNGKAVKVKDLLVKVTIFGKDGKEIVKGELKIPDVLAHGDTKDFTFDVPGAKGYVTCASEVGYSEEK